MRLFRLLIAIGVVVPSIAQAQLGIDAYRNYGYSIDNQFDDVQFNSLSFNFGMARRFMLLHPIEANGSSESHVVGLSALDKSTQVVQLGGHSWGNKVSLGYNTWDGAKIGLTKQIELNEKNQLNVNAVGYGDSRINTLETNNLKSDIEGANVQISYHFDKNKTSFSTYAMAKTDERNYVLYDSLGSLAMNQQLLVWNNVFSYKPSINSTLRAYTGLSLYKGDYNGDFVSYKGNQNLISGGLELEVVRPTWLMMNSARMQSIKAIQPNTTSQNRLELSNIFQPKMEGYNTKIKVRNSIVLTSDNQFYYAPSVALNRHWDKFKIYFNAARSVHTQTNTLERTPYFSANNTGLRNLSIDRFDVLPSLSLRREFTIRGLLAYSRIRNFVMDGQELKGIARANVSLEKRIGSYFSVSSTYNYRFLGIGGLAQLAPKHTAFLELKHSRIKSAYLGEIIGKSLYWNFDLVGGFRGKKSSAANIIMPDVVKNQYFIDFNYRISGFDYYNSPPFSFVFSVRNLLAKNTLIASEQSNASLLFSEGMRVARSFNIGLEYRFNNRRY